MTSAQLYQQRWLRAGSVFIILLIAARGSAQTQSDPGDSGDIRTLVLQLQSELKQTRQDLKQAQQQIQRLSSEVAAMQPTKAAAAPEAAQSSYVAPADVEPDSTSKALESSDSQSVDTTMLRAKVEEQQQTKVESASKYRVKLSGIILMNAFSNRGTTDLPDLANRAFNSASAGNVGATFRQSILGLQMIGPTIANGRTSASISVDFFGGYPQTHYGTTNGVMRLREAFARIDWDKTSVIVGQEAPIIAPLSPTSYATLAEPAFSWAGNLWVWTPQAVVEQRFRTGDSSYFSVSGALMAPLTEDIPTTSQFTFPGPGELSRRPAFAAVTAWHSKRDGHATEIGLGGYTSRLNFEFGRDFETWAATLYWRVPITKLFEFSGEGYRGMGIGGLGGAIWQSAIYNGNPDLPSTVVRPLNSVGGWAQLKYRALPKLEFNAALGQDNVLAYDFRFAPQIVSDYVFPMARNRAAFGNAIYHLRSNVVLSLEYRKLWTYQYTGVRNTADQVNVGAGVSF
jgi:hypothetical protein